MEDFAGDLGVGDKRKWISATEAAALLQLSKEYFLVAAKERGYTRRQAHPYSPPSFLRKEIESWADFRQMQRQWRKKYPGEGGGKRYTEKIDVEMAKRLFITTAEAAALLGVTPCAINRMARTGRLVCYKSEPGYRSAPLWFSRRALLQIAEDPDYLKHRAAYWKGRRDMGGAVIKPRAAQYVRKGVPKGWLTAEETAKRLGVSRSRVQGMRLTGRLHGEHIWRRNKPMKYWYYPDYEVERAISWRQQAKEAQGQPLQPLPTAANEPPPCAAPIAAAPPVPASEERKKAAPPAPQAGSPFRLDADGPEPKWACDDEDLTRAFFLLDRPGD